jgi:tetratricopeptide (TPR) repeat protein
MPDTQALYKRADEAFQKHNYDYARDLFLQILLLEPDNAQSRLALFATLLKKFQEQGATGKITLMARRGQFEVTLKATKDPQKRIGLCQDYLNLEPQNSKIRTVLAESLLALNHYNGAAAEGETALKSDPSNVAAAKVLVSAYIQLKKVKEAQTILERIQSLIREDRDLEKLQRDLAALQTMKQGFEDASGKEGYRKVIKNADQADDYEKEKRLIQTEADFQVAVEKLETEMGDNPTDARLPKRVGDLYFDKKKDYKVAQDWYKKAAALAPQDSVLRDKVDDCTLRQLEAAREAVPKTDAARIREADANLLRFKIQSYERRVHDRPTDMGLRYELGRAYYGAGPSFLDKAIGEFQQSVRDPKKKSESHLYLGLSFQRKKMYDMADKQYVHAEEGVLSDERKRQILYNRAVCNAEAGNLGEAIKLGKQIMETDIGYRDISQLVDKWQNGQKS